MNCPSCGAADHKLKVIQHSRLWGCLDCACEFEYNNFTGSYKIIRGRIMGGALGAPPIQKAPLGIYSLSVASPGSGSVQPSTVKFEDYSRKEWDRVKEAIDAWPEYQKQMAYFYLNKIGNTIYGIEQKIEEELKKKFKEAK